MSDQYTPTGGQTIFPRINFLKTFNSRLAQRIANGRVFLGGIIDNLFGDAVLDLNFAKTKDIGNLTTFTRASTAVYRGSDGLVKTAAIDAPRFDHDPVTSESLGLLIEESRTNALAASEELSASYYTKSFLTVTADQSTAPDGNTTADEAIPTTSGTYHRIVRSGITVTAPCVISLFVKANGYNHFQLRLRGASASRATAFDVSNGTVTQEMEAGVGETAIGMGLTPVDYGNGWWRLSMVRTDTDTINTIDLSVLDTGTPGSQTYGFVGDGTSSVFLWGAMIEEGSLPTSYIPTTSGPVTRAADVVSITGTDFSSWFNQSEGTVFSDVTTRWLSGRTDNGTIIQCGSGASPAGRLFQRRRGSSGNHAFQFSGSDVIVSVPTYSYKAASRYNTTSYKTCANGTLSNEGSVVTGDLTTLTRAQIGSNGSNFLNGWIKRLAVLPTRTDQELIDLTT